MSAMESDSPSITTPAFPPLPNLQFHLHSLAHSWSKAETTHANGITQLMTAQAEIDKLGASDQLRAEIDKIIAAASSTWTSCVEFRAETSKFAQEAFASHKILEEQLLADGTRMRQELERSELFRRREFERLNKEKFDQAETYKAEIARLGDGWIDSTKQGSQNYQVAVAVMRQELTESEATLQTETQKLQTQLELAQNEAKRALAAKAAEAGVLQKENQRQTVERAKIEEVRAVEKREETKARGKLQDMVKQAVAARENAVKQAADERKKCFETVNNSDKDVERRLRELAESKQRDLDNLSNEVKRLRAAIDEALQPNNLPNSEARQRLYFEAMKERFSKAAVSRLAGAADPSLSWRGQTETLGGGASSKEQLKQPRMSFGKVNEKLLVRAPGQPPTKKPATSSPRERRARPASAMPVGWVYTADGGHGPWSVVPDRVVPAAA